MKSYDHQGPEGSNRPASNTPASGQSQSQGDAQMRPEETHSDPHARPGPSTEQTSGSEEAQQPSKGKSKGGIHNNALYAASMGRSATAQVNPHSDRDFANTGTNISYEGPTAPGSGGSVGTGYASGKQAVDPTLSTSSDFDMARMGHGNKDDQESDRNEDIQDDTKESE